MKYTFTLILVLILFPNLFSQKVVGYVPYYRSLSESFDYSLYTHIHYFAIWPQADGSFHYPGSMDSISMAEDFHKIAELVQAVNVNMIMTFGGTSEGGSAHFTEMASDDIARANFINNVSDLCDSWAIDGIDIDWEWHAPADTAISNKAYRSLMTDVRSLCTSKGISFSIDISPSSWNGRYSPSDAVNLADYLNVMTYSYNGSWSSTSGHHSPLSKGVDTGLAYWTGQGIPESKLNLGVAFYGIEYSGTHQNGSSFTSTSSHLYREVEELIHSGYSVVEDNTHGSYCYSSSDNRIIYYESPNNVATKMRYAIDNNLGGIIIWELAGDNFEQELSQQMNHVRNNAPVYVDTLWVYETIRVNDTTWAYDTIRTTLIDTSIVWVYDSIAVTDTLIIDVTISGLDPPDNLNTLKVYPNPAKELIYIHTGENFEQMSDFKIKIINTSGQHVFESYVNQELFEIDLNDFGTIGLFFLHIVDESNNIVGIRKVILE